MSSICENTVARQGATPADWDAFVDRGLGSDLLPYVADPTAKPSEMSKISEPGKVPSRFNAAGEMVGIPKWTSHVATEQDIARWRADPRLGICVIARQVKAIDVDIPDPVHAREVLNFLQLTLPPLARRTRSNSGKFLAPIALGGPLPKRIIKTPYGNIELLGDKQQFLACGLHPSGVRYEWVDGDGVASLPDTLPAVTLAELDVVWQGLIDQFGLPDGASESRTGVAPTTPRRASDIDDPRVAYLEEQGLVLDYERDGKVHVRCPFEDGHSTDSGPSSTTYFPAGVGGFAQGHWKCLHASCAEREDVDYDEAIRYGAHDFEVLPALRDATGAVVVPLPALRRDKTGAALATKANVTAALRRLEIAGRRVAYDRFLDDLMISDAHGASWRRFKKTDYLSLGIALEEGTAAFKDIRLELIRDAVKLVATENAFDSAQDWLASLIWDGVPRVDDFCSRYFGAAQIPYARAVSRYLWSGLAGRVIEPGAKADMLVTLISTQGTGKTTSVEAIAPHREMFVEVSLTAKDTDLARSMRGKLVGEIAELRGLRGRDSESIKAWLSRRFEEWVPKYDEFTTRSPRRCMLIGTTNTREYLDDETGERRHLPLEVGASDVPAMVRDCAQLWAEGADLFIREGICWREAHQLATAEHAAFKVTDPWQDRIAAWLTRNEMDGAGGTPRGELPLRTSDVMTSGLGLPAAAMNKAAEMRVGRVLGALGFKRTLLRSDGKPARLWVRGAAA